MFLGHAGRVYTHAAAVGAIAQREGIPYLLDATQTVGQMPIDVQQLQCDYLTSTGRKFLRAPRGTGLLYASRCDQICYAALVYPIKVAGQGGRQQAVSTVG